MNTGETYRQKYNWTIYTNYRKQYLYYLSNSQLKSLNYRIKQL